MSKHEKIDKLLKHRLKQSEAQPPAHVWERLESSLDKRHRNNVLLLWTKVMSAAAVIVVALVIGWYLNSQMQPASNEIAVTEKTVDVPSQESTPNEIILVEESQPGDTETEADNFLTGIPVKEVIAQDTPPQKNIIAKTDRSAEDDISLLELISLKGLKESVDMLAELVTTSNAFDREELAMTELTSLDKEIVAMNIAAMNKKEVVPTTISLGVQMGKTETLKNGVNEQSALSQYGPERSSSLNIGNGTGITIEVKASKRFSIQSGVVYSKMNQMNSGLLYTNEIEEEPGGLLRGPAQGMESLLDWETSGVWGELKMREIPDQSIAAENVMGGLENEVSYFSEQGINLQAEYVEVPLIVKYKILDRRFGVSFLGGASANFLIANDIYLDNGDGSSKVGKVTNMSQLTYSSTFGMGLNYSVSRNVALNLEPKFKYYMGSLTDKNYVKLQPLVFGVYGGISYEF